MIDAAKIVIRFLILKYDFVVNKRPSLDTSGRTPTRLGKLRNDCHPQANVQTNGSYFVSSFDNRSASLTFLPSNPAL